MLIIEVIDVMVYNFYINSIEKYNLEKYQCYGTKI